MMGDRSVYKSVGLEEDTTGIAKRVAQITVSAIKQMPLLASQVEGCVSLRQGIPSFATPLFIREAVIEELRKNDPIGKYSLQPGVPELKIEIAKSLQQTKGIPANPEANVCVSCGAMEALAAGIATIIERGDEVLLASPNYSSHIEQILFAEGKPVFVPSIEEGGWSLDIEGFKRAITPKTKVILICCPMNPTGSTHCTWIIVCAITDRRINSRAVFLGVLPGQSKIQADVRWTPLLIFTLSKPRKPLRGGVTIGSLRMPGQRISSI